MKLVESIVMHICMSVVINIHVHAVLFISLIFMAQIVIDPKATLVGALMASHVVAIELLSLVQTQRILIMLDVSEVWAAVVHQVFLFLDRLHLDDEITGLDRDIFGVELARVGIEATCSLVPS